MASPLRRPPAPAPFNRVGDRLRPLIRRVPVWRTLAVLVTATIIIQTMTDMERTTRDAQAAWGAEHEVWVVARPVDAGAMVMPGDVVRQLAPPALRPVDAIVADPTGQRTRTTIVTGEIVRDADLAASGSGPVAALVAPGRHGITIEVGAEIHAVGDVVGLAAVLDGRALLDDGEVISVQPGSITVAIAASAVPTVVGEFSRGGVEVTLVGR